MKKQKVLLVIDTSKIESVYVAVEINGRRHEKVFETRALRSQAVLPLIEELLSEQKLKPFDITEIQVHPGPGSFTGLRVGVAVGNILGFLLGVSVNGKPPGILIPPGYGASKW